MEVLIERFDLFFDGFKLTLQVCGVAGMLEGDTIKAINGEPIIDNDDLMFNIAASLAGTEVTITVERFGRTRIELRPVLVRELTDRVVASFAPQMKAQNLTMKVNLPEKLPPVLGDPHRLGQVFDNLMSNALKFTHEGGIDVSVCPGAAAGTASIAVSDTGIGIAPEHHENIFEDFRQVDDSPSRQYGGTGLGLAICRRLAHALGGRMTLTSAVGKGSTFTLTIPVDAPQ